MNPQKSHTALPAASSPQRILPQQKVSEGSLCSGNIPQKVGRIAKYKRPKQKEVGATTTEQSSGTMSNCQTQVSTVPTSPNNLEDPLLLNFCPIEPEYGQDEIDPFESTEEELDSLFIPSAKAWMLVEHFDALVKQFAAEGPTGFLRIVELQDMVDRMERFLDKQAEFRSAGKPCTVDIGYHYTRPGNMGSIKNAGLLSRQERTQRGITTQFNGTAYGEGIYTGENPGDHFGRRYGSVGLLVLRVKGRVGTNPRDGTCDTVVDREGSNCRIVVLKHSEQCVPIIRFDATKIDRHDLACRAPGLLYDLHRLVQEYVDSIINEVADPPPEIATTRKKLTLASSPKFVKPRRVCPAATLGTIMYTAPQRRTLGIVGFIEVFPFPTSLSCCVCRELLGKENSSTVIVTACSHLVHRDCIKSACPVCGLESECPVPLGNMPDGTMQVTFDGLRPCPGHSFGSFRIEYNFPKGIQKNFHPNPGQEYNATRRVAFLPNTREGRILLARLQEAFRYGFSFTIGTSLTTRLPNSVTWALPHKSSLTGGPAAFGFPDPTYIADANAVLDDLFVKPGGTDDTVHANVNLLP